MTTTFGKIRTVNLDAKEAEPVTETTKTEKTEETKTEEQAVHTRPLTGVAVTGTPSTVTEKSETKTETETKDES